MSEIKSGLVDDLGGMVAMYGCSPPVDWSRRVYGPRTPVVEPVDSDAIAKALQPLTQPDPEALMRAIITANAAANQDDVCDYYISTRFVAGGLVEVALHWHDDGHEVVPSDDTTCCGATQHEALVALARAVLAAHTPAAEAVEALRGMVPR